MVSPCWADFAVCVCVYALVQDGKPCNGTLKEVSAISSLHCRSSLQVAFDICLLLRSSPARLRWTASSAPGLSGTVVEASGAKSKGPAPPWHTSICSAYDLCKSTPLASSKQFLLSPSFPASTCSITLMEKLAQRGLLGSTFPDTAARRQVLRWRSEAAAAPGESALWIVVTRTAYPLSLSLSVRRIGTGRSESKAQGQVVAPGRSHVFQLDS